VRLDYGTQLSPHPVKLSIGSLRKPTLGDISNPAFGMSFEKFYYYELLMKLTPEIYYSTFSGDEGASYWNSLSEEQQAEENIFDIIINSPPLAHDFLEMFNFFFVETVILQDGFFVLLKPDTEVNDDLDLEQIQDKIVGVMTSESFDVVIDLMQQICCIHDKEEDEEEEPVFKNEIAKKLFLKMQEAEKQRAKEKKADLNFTIPNIISAVASKHPSINLVNIWDLTMFQLMETFSRIQMNAVYDINALRVSVWGDEKKTFDPALWYKNSFDKKRKTQNN